MKNLKIPSLVLILTVAILFSCKDKKDDPPSDEVVQLGLLAKTWKSSSVTYQGSPDSGDWSSFTITITDGSYTSSGVSDGRDLVWPSTGTWVFKDAGTDNVDVNTAVRGDGVEILLTVDEANLTMSFTYDESINGRVNGINGIDGPWIFSMTN